MTSAALLAVVSEGHSLPRETSRLQARRLGARDVCSRVITNHPTTGPFGTQTTSGDAEYLGFRLHEATTTNRSSTAGART